VNCISYWLFSVIAALALFRAAPCAGADDTPDLAKIKIAAESGDPAAQDKLAERYLLQSDVKQAELWYRKAAWQGNAHAQAKLGGMFLSQYNSTSGLALAKKNALGHEACKWFTLAAGQGDTEAQGSLATLYHEGKLVPQDLLAAYKWGALAARGPKQSPGAQAGSAARDAAILQMTPEQIAAAKQQVAAFRPGQGDPFQPIAMPLPEGLQLKGISGTPNRRFAIINNQTFAEGEVQTVKLPGNPVVVRCIAVRTNSVLISVKGNVGTHELKLE
jgi:hypothetical protein